MSDLDFSDLQALSESSYLQFGDADKHGIYEGTTSFGKSAVLLNLIGDSKNTVDLLSVLHEHRDDIFCSEVMTAHFLSELLRVCSEDHSILIVVGNEFYTVENNGFVQNGSK